MGTSIDSDVYRYIQQDHPHAYGDKHFLSSLVSPSNGSSPRVWGQDFRVLNAPLVPGIIPTRMGTRGRVWCGVARYGDHPHAYGDKPKLHERNGNINGSSPRVWGQEQYIDAEQHGNRIIPTRMGTRLVRNLRFTQCWDHPHAYGDKTHTAMLPNRNSGSSPRVWGQADGKYSSCRSHRIIPTRMGTR